jgi:hypothetical protein
MYAIENYAATGGAQLGAPADWPTGSLIQPSRDRFTVVMFLHPHCPCSSASVSQLERLIARCGTAIDARAVLTVPPDAPIGWNETSLADRLKSIPHVKAETDFRGEEARRFGALTSGHVVAFDIRGRMVFSGGITGARGHEGDNAAMDALTKLIRGQAAGPVRAEVFGCELETPESTR